MTIFDIGLVISVILFILLVFLWSRYNSFVRKQNQVSEDFSDVDIQLKRRADLIDQLVEVVKGYSKHEKTVFEKITKARSALNRSSSISEYTKADNMYTTAFKGILAVVENYPNLKANETYKELMINLKETEDNIAQYREIYNQSVRRYNNSIQTFPNMFAAQLLGFKTMVFFEFLISADKYETQVSQ